MSDDVERERAKYEALSALVDGYRRERDDAREERDLARERFEHAVQSATRYAVERDEARAEVERLRETKDYLRTWLSSEELEGLRVKAAEHPLLWEEIHHLKAEVERLREALEADGET